jgi:hypothetical protein
MGKKKELKALRRRVLDLEAENVRLRASQQPVPWTIPAHRQPLYWWQPGGSPTCIAPNVQVIKTDPNIRTFTYN